MTQQQIVIINANMEGYGDQTDNLNTFLEEGYIIVREDTYGDYIFKFVLEIEVEA